MLFNVNNFIIILLFVFISLVKNMILLVVISVEE